MKLNVSLSSSGKGFMPSFLSSSSSLFLPMCTLSVIVFFLSRPSDIFGSVVSASLIFFNMFECSCVLKGKLYRVLNVWFHSVSLLCFLVSERVVCACACLVYSSWKILSFLLIAR